MLDVKATCLISQSQREQKMIISNVLQALLATSFREKWTNDSLFVFSLRELKEVPGDIFQTKRFIQIFLFVANIFFALDSTDTFMKIDLALVFQDHRSYLFLNFKKRKEISIEKQGQTVEKKIRLDKVDNANYPSQRLTANAQPPTYRIKI